MARVPAVQISTWWTPAGVLVAPSGEIDALSAPVLGATLDSLVQAGHREVVLDLAGVSFVDGAGLGAIAGAALRLRGIDGVFLVRSPRPMARRLLVLAELDRFIESPTRNVVALRSERGEPSETSAPTPWFRSGHEGNAELLAGRVSDVLADAAVDRAGGSIGPRLLGALQSRALISQAQGVIMARYGVSAETAFVALRRSSESTGRSINQRAGEIVAGTVREDLIGDLRI